MFDEKRKKSFMKFCQLKSFPNCYQNQPHVHVILTITKNIDAIFYDLKNEGIQKKKTQHEKKKRV